MVTVLVDLKRITSLRTQIFLLLLPLDPALQIWLANMVEIQESLGISLHSHENGQWKFGRPLWEIPDLCIKNSPILQLDRVTSPILIVHNKKDPFSRMVSMA